MPAARSNRTRARSARGSIAGGRCRCRSARRRPCPAIRPGPPRPGRDGPDRARLRLPAGNPAGGRAGRSRRNSPTVQLPAPRDQSPAVPAPRDGSSAARLPPAGSAPPAWHQAERGDRPERKRQFPVRTFARAAGPGAPAAARPFGQKGGKRLRIEPEAVAGMQPACGLLQQIHRPLCTAEPRHTLRIRIDGELPLPVCVAAIAMNPVPFAELAKTCNSNDVSFRHLRLPQPASLRISHDFGQAQSSNAECSAKPSEQCAQDAAGRGARACRQLAKCHFFQPDGIDLFCLQLSQQRRLEPCEWPMPEFGDTGCILGAGPRAAPRGKQKKPWPYRNSPKWPCRRNHRRRRRRYSYRSSCRPAIATPAARV